MRIGTPLSPSATKVLLLGSGELGKEVIVALQRLGVETIAVDRYANAPGHQVAHRAHVIAMTDAAALTRLIEQERPHIIVPEIEAIATDALVALEAAGVTQVIPTARAAKLTMNREGIRRLAAETLGIPTSPYRFARNIDALQAAIDGRDGAPPIGYPCVVKPVMSSSGKGQSVVRSKAEVAAARGQSAAEAMTTLRHEIEAFGHGLAQKPYVIAANKTDMDPDGAGLQGLIDCLDTEDAARVMAISALQRTGLDTLLENLDGTAGRNPGRRFVWTLSTWLLDVDTGSSRPWFDRNEDDRYGSPGWPVRRQLPDGQWVLRQKGEANPSRPKLLVTEPGVGYRLRDLLKARMKELDDTFEASTWYRDHWTKDRIITRVR